MPPKIHPKSKALPSGVFSQNRSFSDCQFTPGTNTLIWLEQRGKVKSLYAKTGSQKPRLLTCRLPIGGGLAYGGGDFTLTDEAVYAVAKKNALYRINIKTGRTQKIFTSPFVAISSPAISPDKTYILFVWSNRSTEGLAIWSLKDKRAKPRIIVHDADFYMQPRWHPSGALISWISWNKPYMPWQSTYLSYASLVHNVVSKYSLKNIRKIDGSKNSSIIQSEFSSCGKYIFYNCDSSGWMRLHRYNIVTQKTKRITRQKGEIGWPAWRHGQRSFVLDNARGKIYFFLNHNSTMRLCSCDFDGLGFKGHRRINKTYSYFEQITHAAHQRSLAFISADSSTHPSVSLAYLRGESLPLIVRNASAKGSGVFKAARAMALDLSSRGSAPLYGLYYKPLRRGRTPPPAIIMAHGGPIGQYQSSLSKAQYFATRGYAVLEVNYRGSSGYGRRYADALKTRYGIIDVKDCVSAAKYLLTKKLADKHRIAIMGGSSAGMTVLGALIRSPGTFKGAICLYAVSDILPLIQKTHRFEKHYFETLIGPSKTSKALYKERSPVARVHAILTPVCFFHGKDDTIVPPSQTRNVMRRLSKTNPHCRLYLFPGEGHGFKNPKNITAMYRLIDDFLHENRI